MFVFPTLIKKGNDLLKETSKIVTLPLSKEDEQIIITLANYGIVSNNEELTKQYNIKPGVGISAIQLGYPKRMFNMNFLDFTDEKETRHHYNIINPIIERKSKELIYLPGGEGCLSVEEHYEGNVARHEKITFTADFFDIASKRVSKKTMTLKGFPAIVFQHEFDHLDGILYTDKLNKDLDKAKPLFEIEENEE